jgi:hypothetical protein
MRAINLALRFALELCALAALGYDGRHVHAPVGVRLLLAATLAARGQRRRGPVSGRGPGVASSTAACRTQ